MISKKCRINFYDKLTQAKDELGLTDNDIVREIGYHPSGILRLEIQCDDKKIHNIKQKFNLVDNNIEYLWNDEIAKDTILKYIEQMIGKEPIYPFEYSIEKLKKKYTIRIISLCSQIMSIITKNPNSSLSGIKSYCKIKSEFN